ncbi:hypothetical protein FB45DRAFT_1067587 [Roridomyces roridus]|uniref:F-box domain-containing protein n=1 Tax=Roridomyces roridus TaxID=1738132 RepID=A0AAD7FAG2_9AGAR|nr:hypothetical protein FB45DRAFT_1067587 [Roridomyces roridus]
MASTRKLFQPSEGLAARPVSLRTRDPIARLPVELSSDIFLRAASNAQASSVFMRVSRAWNHIALGTPPLWTTLSNDGIPASKLPELLKIWFARGRALPVSLSLGPTQASAFLRTVEVLANNSQRVQTLHVYIPGGCIEEISCISFGALRHLTIDASEDESAGPSAALISLLRGAPNLVECHLNDVFYVWHDHSLDGLESITHSSLQHLLFGKRQDGFKCTTASPVALSRLKLPSLGTLLVFFTDDHTYTETDLLTFLTHSGRGCLVSNTLTELEILHPRNLAQSLFEALDGNVDLLPHLQRLHIRGYLVGYHLPEPQHIFNALNTRRDSLKSFTICVVDEQEAFFGSVATLLRPFADEGVDVYIGTLFKNFV